MSSLTTSVVQQSQAVITPAEAEQRLRQAARILANGAIRAALKQRKASQSVAPDVPKPDAVETPTARPPRTAVPKRKKVTRPQTHIAAVIPI